MTGTLKIKLLFGIYAEENWEATIEIDSKSTLKEFHFTIQNAVNL